MGRDPADAAHAESAAAVLAPGLFRAVRDAWPAVVVGETQLAAYLGARLQPHEIAALEVTRAADLYLACACAERVAGAAEAFRRAFEPELSTRLRDSDALGVDRADLVQTVLAHVLVGDSESGPRIAEYSGRGSLGGWLRVVAHRVQINARRNLRDRADPLPERLEAGLVDSLDAELEYLKAHYRAAFRDTLAKVLLDLAPRERNLLRMQVVHGLSATGIAAIFRVHRATAKRWLAEVRTRVLEQTRERLMAALRVDVAELDSIMRMIESRLEVSVRRHLGETSS